MKHYFYYVGISAVFTLFFLTASCSENQTDQVTASQPEKTVLSGQSGQEQSIKQKAPIRSAPIFRSISPREAVAIIQQRDDLIFLDVRTPQERAYASIAGSSLVNFWDLVRGKVVVPMDKPVLLVCAVGGRSYAAGQVLSKKGYPEIYNLEGGIKQWQKDGLPLVRGETS